MAAGERWLLDVHVLQRHDRKRGMTSCEGGCLCDKSV